LVAVVPPPATAVEKAAAYSAVERAYYLLVHRTSMGPGKLSFPGPTTVEHSAIASLVIRPFRETQRVKNVEGQF
jgi:hypothetical protein